MQNLTIVSSCWRYGKYLRAWAESIAAQGSRPAAVCLFTHGEESDRLAAVEAGAVLHATGIRYRHEHEHEPIDLGAARNRAVAMSDTEWVMHLDADDRLLPGALEEFARLSPRADVIGAGFVRVDDASGIRGRRRLYPSGVGADWCRRVANPCSGVSPFRRSLWEQAPYDEDGRPHGWDWHLFQRFGRLGARFVGTACPVFEYRIHSDSVYQQRLAGQRWSWHLARVREDVARRAEHKTAVVIPVGGDFTGARERGMRFVTDRLRREYPDMEIVTERSDESPYPKSAVVNRGVSRTTADVVIMHDADVLVPAQALRDAVELVRVGAASWVVPGDRLYRLTAAATARMLEDPAEGDGAIDWRPEQLLRRPYQMFAGGGVAVFARDVYEAVRGYPEQFVGWGGEDEAMALIMTTLIGPCTRLDHPVLHLWHEPSGGRSARHANLGLLQALRLWEGVTAAVYEFTQGEPLGRLPGMTPRTAALSGLADIAARARQTRAEVERMPSQTPHERALANQALRAAARRARHEQVAALRLRRSGDAAVDAVEEIA